MLFGPGRQNFLEAGAFLKSRPDLDRPDLQLHCVWPIMQDHGKKGGGAKDGFSIHVCQLRPESRGGSACARPIRSTIRRSSPTIWPPRRTAAPLREGFKMVRDRGGQAALKRHRGADIRAGPAVQTDAEIDAWIRARPRPSTTRSAPADGRRGDGRWRWSTTS
jgi:choline dehydrogenase